MMDERLSSRSSQHSWRAGGLNGDDGGRINSAKGVSMTSSNYTGTCNQSPYHMIAHQLRVCS
jgi:hypothetical protein